MGKICYSPWINNLLENQTVKGNILVIFPFNIYFFSNGGNWLWALGEIIFLYGIMLQGEVYCWE